MRVKIELENNLKLLTESCSVWVERELENNLKLLIDSCSVLTKGELENNLNLWSDPFSQCRRCRIELENNWSLSAVLFTVFSRAAPRLMGAAMICLA